MDISSQYKPPQEFLDQGIKNAWWTFLQAQFSAQMQRPPFKGEIESFAKGYSDSKIFAAFSDSKPYKELPPSCQDRNKAIAILRNATW